APSVPTTSSAPLTSPPLLTVVKVTETPEPAPLPATTLPSEPPHEFFSTTNQEPALPPAGEWTNRWVPVTKWFATNGFGKPARHFDGDKLVFTLLTTNGPIVLRAGSQVATWNHLNCWLGYAPRFTGGELYLHPLDLQKNLLPAIRSPHMAFAAGKIVV